VRRPDRLARLTDLLARVQRNAAERQREIAGIARGRGYAEPAPLPSPLPLAPLERADREPIPPPPLRAELASDPDDWSSLLTAELGDPNPSAVSLMPETRFDSVPALPAALPTASLELVEAPPESQFERAMRISAEQHPAPPDPRALWIEAAEELRERRPTYPPEAEPGGSVEPAIAPVAAPFVDTLRLGEPESLPAPPKSRRRRIRPSPAPSVLSQPEQERPTPYWAVVALSSLVGVAVTLGYLAYRAMDQPRGASSPTVSGAPLATLANTLARPRDPAPATADSGAATIVQPAPAVMPTSSSAWPEPPPIKRPKDMGLLWVESPTAVTVYVQGLPAGENGRYLEVACGLKNVRLARPDPPPAGHSFPMWLAKAEPVLVPCGGANRVRMAAE